MTSPPGPPASPPAAWYPDPQDPERIRYWDGTEWTGHTADAAGPPAPVDEVPAPALLGPGGRAYAGFGRRFLGLAIDWVLLGIPVALLVAWRLGPLLDRFTAALDALGPQPSQEQVNQIAADLTSSLPVETLLGIALLAAGVHLLYFGICLHLWGRTLGGQVMRIRCVDGEGANPSWRQSFTRAAVPVGFNLVSSIPGIGFIGTALGLVNYVSMLWHPQKQAWMDRLAGTFVVVER